MRGIVVPDREEDFAADQVGTAPGAPYRSVEDVTAPLPWGRRRYRPMFFSVSPMKPVTFVRLPKIASASSKNRIEPRRAL